MKFVAYFHEIWSEYLILASSWTVHIVNKPDLKVNVFFCIVTLYWISLTSNWTILSWTCFFLAQNAFSSRPYCNFLLHVLKDLWPTFTQKVSPSIKKGKGLLPADTVVGPWTERILGQEKTRSAQNRSDWSQSYWNVKEGLCAWHHATYFASLCTDWLGTQFQRFMFANPPAPPLVVFCIFFSD